MATHLNESRGDAYYGGMKWILRLRTEPMLQHFFCGGWGRLFIAGALMLAFGVSGPGCSKDDEGDPSGEGQVAADAGGSQSVCSGAASQGKTCDDGDPCTVGDTCNTSGQCISGVQLT